MCHQNNKMKNLLVLITFVFVVQTAEAQMFRKEKIIQDANQGQGTTDFKLLRWGYYLGLSSYDFNFDYKQDLRDIYVERNPGFNVGLIGNLRINSFLDLRLEPGLLITNRILHYGPDNFIGVSDLKERDLLREIKSTYIHIPLLLKVSTKRVNNFKPFIVGGFSTALNLSSNQDNPEDNSAGQFRMKKNTLFYELGFGIDFYLENFKFTPSVRGLFGLNDELVRDADPNSPWTSNVESMQTRGIFINFTFQ